MFACCCTDIFETVLPCCCRVWSRRGHIYTYIRRMQTYYTDVMHNAAGAKKKKIKKICQTGFLFSGEQRISGKCSPITNIHTNTYNYLHLYVYTVQLVVVCRPRTRGGGLLLFVRREKRARHKDFPERKGGEERKNDKTQNYTSLINIIQLRVEKCFSYRDTESLRRPTTIFP